MPEVVIQGQSANAGFARSGGLGLPPGGTVGASGGEANFAAGVAPWTGDGWVAQTMAGHAARANAGYAVWGVNPYGAGNMFGLRPGGGPSMISPMAGASSPSMSFMQPPEMVLTNALANALGRSPLTGSAYGSVLYNLNRMREDDDIIAQRSAAQRASVDGMWRESFRWGPSSMDAPTMPAPPGGWPVGVPAFLRYQHNARGDGRGVGAGGGGGGGGGGFGGDGGWGRGVPFAGAFGFGATSRLLTGSLTAGVAAAAAEELAFAPQTFGHLEGGAIGAAAPYRNMVFDSYALARAGGFKGENLLGSIYTGVKPPEWMEKLGLGPTEALRMLSGFGIAQGNDPANRSLIQGIAGMQFTPAFSGLNMEGSVSQAARYGVVSGNAGGVEQYTQQMAPVMTIAVQQGFDRSALAQSIDTAVKMQGMSGAGGVGFDMGAFGKFLLDYKDLPGGRTGEAGLNAAQRLQQGLAGVGHDANDTFTYLNLEKNIRTPAQLKTFLNSNPDQPNYYQSIMDNPVTSQMVQYYFDLQAQGNDIGAEMYLSQIVGGGGTHGVPANAGLARSAFLTSPAYRQMEQASPGMGALAIGLTHQETGELIAGQQAAQRQRLQGMYAYYKAQGLPDNAIAAVMADASAEADHNRDGSWNTTSPNMGGGGQGAWGFFQLRGDRLSAFTRRYGHKPGEGPDQEQYEFQLAEMRGTSGYRDPGAEAAGRVLMNSASSPEADSDAMLTLYSRPGNIPGEVDKRRGLTRQYLRQNPSRADASDNFAAWQAADVFGNQNGSAAPSAPGQNMPPLAALTAYSDALAGVMKGSEISFTDMNVIIPAVNKALAEFAKHIADANRQFTLGRPSQGMPSYLMLPGN